MTEESIKHITVSGRFFAPTFLNHYISPDVNINGHCLKNNISIQRKLINLYISLILSPWLRDLSTNFTLHSCLFWSIELTENTDPDKNKYSGYSIGFDSCSEFSLSNGFVGKYVISIGVDISLFVLIDNKNKDILNFWWRTNTTIRWYYINSRS